VSTELKILSLVSRYLPLRAGADNMMHQVHRWLVGQGHQVVAVATRDNEAWLEAEEIDGVQVVRPLPDYGHQLVQRAIEEHQPDVLFGQFGLLPYAVEHAHARRLPVVSFCHTAHGYRSPADDGLAEFVDLYVFNSVAAYHEAGCNVRNVIIHPPLERERVVSPVRDPRYVTFINLMESKGTKIFYHLARQFPHLDFLGVEGAYAEQVKKELPNVTFQPHTSNMASVYAKTKILLVPSKIESFGMAGVEAQANGIPVLASDLPGLHEALGSGARFLAPDDKEGWCRELKRLENDYACKQLGEKALENVARFDFDEDMRTLEVILQDVVLQNGTRIRPGFGNLPLEYVRLRDFVVQQLRSKLQREPSEAEVTRIVESADRPDELLEVVADLNKLAQAEVS